MLKGKEMFVNIREHSLARSQLCWEFERTLTPDFIGQTRISVDILKVAVIRLLSEEERSGINALSMPAKAIRDTRLRDPLETLIKAALNKAQSNLDFGMSHEWWRTLKSDQALLKLNLSYSFLSAIQDVARNLETGITAATEDAEAYEVQCRSLYRI